MNTGNKISIIEQQAYLQAKEEYMTTYDELSESMFRYMELYINGNMFEAQMLMDEIENIIGISNHNELLDYIMLGGER